MRKAFNQELLKIAEKDPRVFMILADIGYGEIEGFANAFRIVSSTAVWRSRI